jgi:hypothetical protein
MHRVGEIDIVMRVVGVRCRVIIRRSFAFTGRQSDAPDSER